MNEDNDTETEAETDNPVNEELSSQQGSSEAQVSRRSNNRTGRGAERSSQSKRPATTADGVLTQDIVAKAERASDQLRSKMRGTVQVRLKNGANYVVDGTKGQLAVEKRSIDDADSIIELSEHDLLKLASGHLNPQIAMLSDKVTIAGNPELAIYFFNLVAPN